jgi:hypothetical protein
VEGAARPGAVRRADRGRRRGVVGDALEPAARDALAREIEDAVRAALQVRVAVSVLDRGGLPRGVYKNAIAAVREA